MRPAIILALVLALIVPATALAQADPTASTPEPPAAPDQVEKEQVEEEQVEKDRDAEAEHAPAADEPDLGQPDGGEQAPAKKTRASAGFVNGELQTLPRDQDFGRRSSQLDERFNRADAGMAVVDRRRDISSMADRNILVPTAQTPAEGTVSFTNYNIFGNYLTYAASDDLAVTAGMVLPTNSGDFVTSVSGKYKLYDSRNWLVSVLPFGAYSNGTMNLDTYQFGLGSGLLTDFHATDNIVLTGGAFGFATLGAGYDRYSDDCTRTGFGLDDCDVETVNMVLPAGGHWLAASLGANWYLSEAFSLNVEYILGGSWGTFFGIEDSNGNDVSARRDRFEDANFTSGLLRGRGAITTVGATWSSGTAGLQIAVVVFGGRDNPNTLVTDESRKYSAFPMLSGAFHF